MALSRTKTTRSNGTEEFSGSTWGREFTGSFDTQGTLDAPNPRFAEDAAAFEVKLGTLAFAEGASAAANVADAAVKYMELRADNSGELGDVGKSLDDLYKKCGMDAPGFAGSVGTQVKDIKAAMSDGNVRERLTAVQAFVENVLLTDVMQLGDQSDTLMELMEQAGFHMTKLDEMDASGTQDKWSSPFHQPGADEDSEVANVDVNRANRSDLGLPDVDQQTDLTTQTVSTPLSDREMKVNGVDGANPDPQQLQWMEGAKKILLNEDDKWVKLQRSLSIPLKGGPSGHTYKFMQANQILSAGNSADEMRLACLGYLLPINAHSMIEVMEAAKTFGTTPYPDDETVYRHVKPLSDEQLRDCGKDGRYPDEADPSQIQQTQAYEGELNQASVPEDLRQSSTDSSTTGGGDT